MNEKSEEIYAQRGMLKYATKVCKVNLCCQRIECLYLLSSQRNVTSSLLLDTMVDNKHKQIIPWELNTQLANMTLGQQQVHT